MTTKLRSLFAVLILMPFAVRGAYETPLAPKGFYLLNDQKVTVAKMKLPTFLSGFTLRLAWKDIETTKGIYNFALIDSTVTYLQAHNLKLTLDVFASMPPSYVVKGASSTFTNAYGTAPTPWDTFAQTRWQALLTALSNYQVLDASVQRKVALRDHPTLTAINAPVVGLQSIRDVTGALVTKKDYDRTKFINAVSTEVGFCRDAFPHDYRFIGFFRMSDSNGAVPLDQAVFDRLQTDFMADGKGGLGLFQEVWSDVGPDPLALGSFLVGVNAPNAVMLQALTSWKKPFTDSQKVASGNPDGALDNAYVNFGCLYFEVYYADVIATDLQPVFTDWASFLATH